MNNYKFTFETENDYFNAERTGHIDSFDIVRVAVKYPDECTVDFPIKSREEFEKFLNTTKGKIVEIYPAVHSYTFYDYL